MPRNKGLSAIGVSYMLKNILPVAAIAAMVFGGAAFAGTTAVVPAAPAATTSATAPAATTMAAMTPTVTEGVIKSIGSKNLYVVLTNGNRYHFAKGFALTAFKVGEKVSVTWEWKDKRHAASAMTAV